MLAEHGESDRQVSAGAAVASTSVRDHNSRTVESLNGFGVEVSQAEVRSRGVLANRCVESSASSVSVGKEIDVVLLSFTDEVIVGLFLCESGQVEQEGVG